MPLLAFCLWIEKVKNFIWICLAYVYSFCTRCFSVLGKFSVFFYFYLFIYFFCFPILNSFWHCAPGHLLRTEWGKWQYKRFPFFSAGENTVVWWVQYALSGELSDWHYESWAGFLERFVSFKTSPFKHFFHTVLVGGMQLSSLKTMRTWEFLFFLQW